ncbi:glycosyltransferase family 4 protein [Yimella sp. cx-51]|uniref:glycosyltransferase family 4 protein n=1 Tax=Yimella sp. cx-51 TaxID=2770551 RepID=UPI00165D60EC|nr:glycosyltransferase family 4 protein [Yimella sp. cx-51]MBC9958209.1 glycosyltransferase family 4 protein [Yimella sp. cx-51]QTH38758.1 glycosyltransferase family 4 protein [Yimella sp. cx-51]
MHAIRSDGFAGVEAHVLRLALAQAASGDELVVIGGAPDRMAAPLAASGVRHVPAASTLDVARALVDQRGSSHDIVHAHMTAAELAVAAVRPKTPVVTTRHFAQPRGSSAVRRRVFALAARGFAAQIAVSEYVAEQIEGPSTVVRSGVPRHDAPSPSTRERIALVVQRLAPEKYTDVALTAFARSALAADGWQLHIAGDGIMRSALESMADQLGIGAATVFLGHRTDVSALMDRASMLIAPMPFEALGLVVLEAMAGGLPVVAAGGGGHLETVGQLPDAAMFTPGSTDEAAAHLRTLAANPDRRLTYGAGLRDVQRMSFTIEAQVEATAAVYRSVL